MLCRGEVEGKWRPICRYEDNTKKKEEAKKYGREGGVDKKKLLSKE